MSNALTAGNGAIEARTLARDGLLMEDKAGDIASRMGFGSSIANRAQRDYLTAKWRPLVEGVEQSWTKGVIAQLLENNLQYLSSMNEETRAINAGEFTKFIFPLVRRVWANLISNNLVSVQPMTAPVGAIFFFEYKYGTSKGPIAAGSNLIESFDSNYSSDFISNEAVATGVATAALPFTTPGGLALDFRPVIPGTVAITITNPATGALVATITDVGATGVLTGPVGVTGSVNYSTGEILITFAAPFPALPATISIFANYRYNMEMNPDIPQVNLDISFQEIRAKTRKMKALWSPEASDDIRAFHGSDIETELVAGIASNMALEIDREIINDLVVAAESAGAVTAAENPSLVNWNSTAPPNVPEIFHIRSIMTNISAISALIQKRTLRGFANWIVTSPEASALLLQLSTHGDFRPIWAPDGSPLGAAPEQVGGPYGMYKFGILGNRWNVYVDPYFPSNKMLIGFKGQSFLDAGYTYAPYIPLQVTPTLFDPGDQSFRKGLRTRYATKLINPKFYAVLNLVKT